MAVHGSSHSIVTVVGLAMAMILATDSIVVSPGDTLSELAAENGVSLDDLIVWNNITNPDLIIAGRELLLSDPQASSAAATVAAGGTTSPGTTEYVVRPGDTLSVIVRRFGTTMIRVIELNAISNPNLIYAGQTIQLASTPGAGSSPSRTVYTVVRGDTLSGIAARFRVTVAAMAAANSVVDTDLIMAGTKLIIPAGEANHQITPPMPTTIPPAAAPVTTTTLPGPSASTATTTTTTTTTAPPPAPAATTTSTVAPAATVPDPTVIGSRSLSPLFEKWAGVYSVPKGLLEAIAWKESNWKPDAIGPSGHLGIAQISPSTIAFIEANLLGLRTDPLSPSDGIRLEARYLRYLIDRTPDERLALAAWNQGLHDLLTNGPSESGSRYAADVINIRDTRARPDSSPG